MEGFRALRERARGFATGPRRERALACLRVAVVLTALALGLHIDRAGRLNGAHLGWGSGPIDLVLSPDGSRLFVAQINENAVLALAPDDGRVLERATFAGRPLVLTWSARHGRPLVSFQDRPDVCEVRAAAKATRQPWLAWKESGPEVQWTQIARRTGDDRCFVPEGPNPERETRSADTGSSRSPADATAATQREASSSARWNFGTWGMATEADGSLVCVRNDGREQQAAEAIQVLRMRPREPSGWEPAGASPWISLGRRDWAALPWPVVPVAATGEVVVVEPPGGRIYVLDASLRVERSASVGRYVKSIVLDAERDRIYAADEKDGVVRAVDFRTLAVVDERATGAGPLGLLADPDTGSLWVANHFSDRISRLAVPGLEPRGVLAAPARPVALALDRANRRLFAAQLRTGTVVRWDGVGGDATTPAMTTLLAP